MSRRFTCEKCKKTFDKGWSDEDALKEYEVSPWNLPQDGKGLVCDDCFTDFKKWFDSLTPEQHEKIRKNIPDY